MGVRGLSSIESIIMREVQVCSWFCTMCMSVSSTLTMTLWLSLLSSVNLTSVQSKLLQSLIDLLGCLPFLQVFLFITNLFDQVFDLLRQLIDIKGLCEGIKPSCLPNTKSQRSWNLRLLKWLDPLLFFDLLYEFILPFHFHFRAVLFDEHLHEHSIFFRWELYA